MNNFILFLQIGIRHILQGYDHILFLIGLIILTKNIKSILKVASAFTVTHSTTLVLSALGVLSINPNITEALIAVSIIYVGVENISLSENKESKYRWVVAGSFGLIHGAGFSGHLTEILKSMMDMGSIWSPLFGFNFGIEIGQVVIIAITFPVFYFLKNYWTKKVVINFTSAVIVFLGLIMFIQRI